MDCLANLTHLLMCSFQNFCPFHRTVGFYEIVTACEVLCVLWKCCVSLEKHPKTSDKEDSLCLVWCLEVGCCVPTEMATHSLFLSSCLSVHQLKGFTLRPRRPTTIMNRSLMLWIPSVCTHQCVSHTAESNYYQLFAKTRSWWAQLIYLCLSAWRM